MVLPTAEAACLRVAEMAAQLLAARPDSVLALPAGSTPRPVYGDLARLHRGQGLSFARATAFTLASTPASRATIPPPSGVTCTRRSTATSIWRPSARTRPTPGRPISMPSAKATSARSRPRAGWTSACSALAATGTSRSTSRDRLSIRGRASSTWRTRPASRRPRCSAPRRRRPGRSPSASGRSWRRAVACCWRPAPPRPRLSRARSISPHRRTCRPRRCSFTRGRGVGLDPAAASRLRAR